MKTIHKYYCSVICLIPFCLIAGPFLSDLFAIIASLFFIYLTVKNKNFYYYKNYFFLFFLIYCIYLIFRSLFSGDKLLSLESSLFYFRHGFFALSIWYILENEKKFINYFTYSIVVALFIVSLDALIQYLLGFNILGFKLYYPEQTFQYDKGSVHRLSGFFGHELILGSYLSRLLPLGAGLLLYLNYLNPSKKLFFFFYFIIIFSTVIIFITGERAAFLYSVLFIFILIFFTKFKIYLKFIILIFSFVTIFSLVISDEKIKERMIFMTLCQSGFLSETFDKENKYLENCKKSTSLWDWDERLAPFLIHEPKLFNQTIFTTHHTIHYLTAYKMFLSNPLFGIGPKLFRIYCLKENFNITILPGVSSCSTHPHNTYFQLLAETGLFGAFPVILLFFLVSFVFLKQGYYIYFKKDTFISDYNLCFFTALLITLWPIIPTGSFFNNWINIIYFFPIGFLLYFNKNQAN